MKIVWVFYGTTESGDMVGPYVFSEKPSIKKVQEILMRDWPSEFERDEEDWIDPNFGYISQWYLEDTGVIEV